MLVRVSQRPGGAPAPASHGPRARPPPGLTVPQIGIIRAFASYVSGWTGSYRHTNLEKRIPQFFICHPRATVLGESARDKSVERGCCAEGEAATARLRARREPESEEARG